jgi:hypothetical protein
LARDGIGVDVSGVREKIVGKIASMIFHRDYVADVFWISLWFVEFGFKKRRLDRFYIFGFGYWRRVG